MEVSMTSIDQIIRERAYYIWLHEGRPDGCSDRHWARAAEQVYAVLKLLSDFDETRRSNEQGTTGGDEFMRKLRPVTGTETTENGAVQTDKPSTRKRTNAAAADEFLRKLRPVTMTETTKNGAIATNKALPHKRANGQHA
jgi:hypothetical protein